MLEGRSSVGRLGLFVHVTAGFGDVGFKIVDLRDFLCSLIKIYPSVEIYSWVHHSIEGEVDPYSGKYQGIKIFKLVCSIKTSKKMNKILSHSL